MSVLNRYLSLLAFLGCAVWMLSGCGSQAKYEEQQSTAETRSQPKDEPAAPVALLPVEEAPEGAWTDPKTGQPMFGPVPLNVWDANPLQTASNNAVAANTAPNPMTETPVAVAPMNNAPTTPMPMPATPAAPASDWGAMISAEVLQSEVTKLSNQLKANLQNVGEFGRTYKEVRMRGATVAALAGIATEHPEASKIRWNDKAKFLRDVGKMITEASKGPGGKILNETKLEFEKAEAILSGSVPAGVDASTPDQRPFNDVADRMGVMQRMELAFNWLKANITTEGVMKEKSEEVTHEAEVLAALSAVIATKEYTSADESEYAAAATGIVTDSQAMVAAVKDGNYQNFADAVTRVQKRCDDCHAEYRFAGG